MWSYKSRLDYALRFCSALNQPTYGLASNLRWNYVAVLELSVPDVLSGALELGDNPVVAAVGR